MTWWGSLVRVQSRLPTESESWGIAANRIAAGSRCPPSAREVSPPHGPRKRGHCCPPVPQTPDDCAPQLLPRGALHSSRARLWHLEPLPPLTPRCLNARTPERWRGRWSLPTDAPLSIAVSRHDAAAHAFTRGSRAAPPGCHAPSPAKPGRRAHFASTCLAVRWHAPTSAEFFRAGVTACQIGAIHDPVIEQVQAMFERRTRAVGTLADVERTHTRTRAHVRRLHACRDAGVHHARRTAGISLAAWYRGRKSRPRGGLPVHGRSYARRAPSAAGVPRPRSRPPAEHMRGRRRRLNLRHGRLSAPYLCHAALSSARALTPDADVRHQPVGDTTTACSIPATRSMYTSRSRPTSGSSRTSRSTRQPM